MTKPPASNIASDYSMSKAFDASLYLASAAMTATGLVRMRGELMENYGFAELTNIFPSITIYLMGLGLWVFAMTRNPLSVAYPIGTGVAIIGSVIGGILFLEESIDMSKGLGILLVLLGVFVIGCNSKQTARQ